MSVDPNDPTVLRSLDHDIEAAALVAALAAHGVEATTTGGYTAGFRAEAPGRVDVIVRHADLARAQTALAEIERQEPKVDWSQVDVGEPEG